MTKGVVWWTCAALAAAAVGLFAALAPAAADPPMPYRSHDPPDGLCLVCHGQPGLTAKTLTGDERELDEVELAVFEASAHGETPCVACHPAQSTLPHLRLARPDRPDAGAALRCQRCHGNAYRSFLESAHGTMVDLGDSRAPACTDCHGGPHEVKPVAQWAESDRAQACAECHSGAGTNFLQALSHEEPSPGNLPIAFFAGRFLVILTAAVLAFGIVHVELEMLRWFARRRRAGS